MKGEQSHIEFQDQLEEAVIKYQGIVPLGNATDTEMAYKRIVSLYNPLDYYYPWHNQYGNLFDSQEDFMADYLKVFITVLLGWKPRNKRTQSRYEGTGEFKNYFIGSLYHNYINLVKSDQAAKRNTTKQCPICEEWVNPISTHIITFHSELLWMYLEEMEIDIESLTGCPMCSNFKIAKGTNDRNKITQLLKAHFISKHTSLLFNKFNELYPGISTFSPKLTSTKISEGTDELDIYDITEDSNNLINKLYALNLGDAQKEILEHILNGETNPVYKTDKYKCTRDEWDTAMENLRETINIYGTE
jgi:hypothetical protein